MIIRFIYFELKILYSKLSGVLLKISEPIIFFHITKGIADSVMKGTDLAFTHCILGWVICIYFQLNILPQLWTSQLPYYWWRKTSYGLGVLTYIRICIYFFIYHLPVMFLIFPFSGYSFGLMLLNQLSVWVVISLMGVMLIDLKENRKNLLLLIYPTFFPISVLTIMLQLTPNSHNLLQLVIGVSFVLIIIAPYLFNQIINNWFLYDSVE